MKAVPSALRRVNEEIVVSYFLRSTQGSRAEVAKATGLSAPTVGKIIDDLLRAGILEARDSVSIERRSATGRPGMTVGLSSNEPAFVLVEIGLEETRIAAVPLAPGAPPRWEARLRTGSRPTSFFERLARVAAAHRFARPRAVLVSMPGVVDETEGRVLFSPNLHWAEKLEWPDRLQAIWSAPVELVQEVRALALGHALTTGSDDFFLVDFGEGVGGAAVIDGQLQRGPLPLACELGHVRVRGNTRRCGCGGVGCLETLVSASGLRMSAAAAGDDCTAPSRNGVPAWLAPALEEAGIAIGAALNVLGLRRVVLTGFLPALGPSVVARLGESIRASSLWSRMEDIEIAAAPRAREPGLVIAGIRRRVIRTEALAS